VIVSEVAEEINHREKEERKQSERSAVENRVASRLVDLRGNRGT
jgi:hypothetical protein